jgi:DNA-binding NarL/FixJ family response regulator
MATRLVTPDTVRARILVVDDNESVRKALSRLLTVEDCVVCGEAVDGWDAIEAARRLKPDLIIMDLSMPGMSGMDAAREIRREFQNLSIMLMTEPDPEITAAARRLGIRGTVSKVGSILTGVRAVLRGAEFF